jgi:hypothetical protein
MNHRFLLRLVTNLAVFLLLLSCLGVVLWVIDEFLMWDILPEAWSLVVRALLVAGGIISFVLLMMNVLLSLALLAESNASQANLPNYGVSAQLKRRVQQSIIAGILAIALLIAGLQITNRFRVQAVQKEAQAEFIQAQADLDTTVDQVIDLFSPELLAAIETNSLAEKGELWNLSKIFSTIPSSFAHTPSATLIVPASQKPFKYARIGASNITTNKAGQPTLAPQLYATLPSQTENQAVEQLFVGKLPNVTAPLAGQIINNTVPSSWGVLKRGGKVIALVYVQSDEPLSLKFPIPAALPEFHHDGPDSLISN